MLDIAIVIASWNGKHLLADCLAALAKQTYQKFKIILIDNGSTDGTVNFVKEKYPEVELIVLDRNYGFAYPNSLGMEKALVDEDIKYVIALNNDTKADEHYIEELVACAGRHPEAGAIQPKVINFFDQGVIDSVGMLIYRDMSAINKGQKEQDAGQYEKEEEIFGASASAALYTRRALETIALPRTGEKQKKDYFDSDYFAYYEDVDLAWRLRLAGFASFYTPKAKVLHVHSATGVNYSPFKAFHIHRNQYYNIIKNLPFGLMLRAFLFMPLRYGLLLSSMIKNKGAAANLSKNTKQSKENVVSIVFRSWKELFRNLPMLIRKRKIIQSKRKVTTRQIKHWLKIYKADIKKIIYGT
jgi:GT2 family glycosyltransferase